MHFNSPCQKPLTNLDAGAIMGGFRTGLASIFYNDTLPIVEEILEAKQPEEQHGFRPGRRLEEHLLTANLLLDKAAAAWNHSVDCKFRLGKGI